MKKIYNTPSVEVYNVQSNEMIANSLNNEVGNGVQLSKESFLNFIGGDEASEEEEN